MAQFYQLMPSKECLGLDNTISHKSFPNWIRLGRKRWSDNMPLHSCYESQNMHHSMTNLCIEE